MTKRKPDKEELIRAGQRIGKTALAYEQMKAIAEGRQLPEWMTKELGNTNQDKDAQ